MEILILVFLLAGLLVFTTGNGIWFWISVLAVASWVGFKAYRAHCPHCGERTLMGRGMRFCNQCGAEQKYEKGFQIRCPQCKGLTRSEMNMAFCNSCGKSQS